MQILQAFLFDRFPVRMVFINEFAVS
jgi:hypothetical protein